VEMSGLIDDEVLNTFAVVADDPADVGPELKKRFGDILTRVSFYSWNPGDDNVAELAKTLSA